MSLEAFLNKFNSADGKFAYTIDPLKTFNVYVVFAHGDAIKGGGSPLQNGIRNVLNNATGGLVGKLANASNGKANQNGYPNIPALVNGSLITDGGGSMLDITFFTQEGTMPNISVIDSEAADTAVGSLKTHKMAVETDSKEFSLKLLNTKVSILDRVFYPWMREISYPYWSYKDQPYETATIKIDFTSHNDIAYVFLGCRPTKIESLNPTNSLDTNMARSVTFAFDYMYIESSGRNSESVKDTLLNTGKTIVNKAASMIGL